MRWVARLFLGVALVVPPALAQTAVEALRGAVDRLGDFDYAERSEASRTLRRTDPDVVLPVLLDALRHHPDSYVQFRAAVLFYGFEVATAPTVFEEALGSRNDRVRAVAYEYFEHAPSRGVVPKLLAALDSETSEFVRPYLVRALAANDDDAVVQHRLIQDIDRGEEYFRGAVIEALGDHRASYAVEPLIRIMSGEGPLRDDALLALGKIGDRRILVPLIAVQRDADLPLQPFVSATACLLDVDCEEQFRYLTDALRYGASTSSDENQLLLRSAATALAALAIDGNQQALDALLSVGLTAGDAARSPIAIALGTVTFRNPALVRAALIGGEMDDAVPEAELLLLRDAFDILDEDFSEERFYTLLRHDYLGSAVASRAHVVAEAAIRTLEF